MTENPQEPTASAASAAPAAPNGPRTRDLVIAVKFALTQVRDSQAPAMAANLAFRTLFGLLPVLVVATILTRAVLGDGFIDLVRRVNEALGLHSVEMAAAAGESRGAPLGVWIEELAAEAARVDLSAIGLVGALAVVFSAVWTMVAIESSFNTIYRAPQGRPLVRRVLIYWFVITAGPVFFAALPIAFRALADFMGADSFAIHIRRMRRIYAARRRALIEALKPGEGRLFTVDASPAGLMLLLRLPAGHE